MTCSCRVFDTISAEYSNKSKDKSPGPVQQRRRRQAGWTEVLGAVQSQGDESFWAFCPACHSVPLWSFAAHVVPHMGSWVREKEEKDLLQNPNCIKLSNKALLSLKEKRIKNSRYIYSGWKKKKPHSRVTGSPSSLIELCQQQPSISISLPSLLSPEWKADYCLT